MRIAICDDDMAFAENLKRLVVQGLKEWGEEPEITVYHEGGAFLEERPACDAVVPKEAARRRYIMSTPI